MSPSIASRTFGLVAGATVLLALVGFQIAKESDSDSFADLSDWHFNSMHFAPAQPEPELPAGQQFFAIPLNGQSPAMKEGQRIDVLYQDESDTTPALIVEDVPIHSTYKGCQDAYPNVKLLLVKEEAERLGLLRNDGGKLVIRFTERKPDNIADKVAQDQE